MKVCILGAGLSSLTLAKALVNENIFVDLLTKKKITQIQKSRTLGISESNVDYFNNNITDIKKILWKIKKIEVSTDNLKNENILNFQNKNNEIFSIIKNYKLYDILKKKLNKNKFFKITYFKNKLPNLKNYNLVINTDFFNPITKKYFYKLITKKYNSFAYTTLIHHEKVNNNIARQIFTKRGPLAFLPVSNSLTSVVYSLHNKSNENSENIKNLINKYNFNYNLTKIEKIDSFELNSFNLRSYYHHNILAFGDLLHRIHPLAGQGFNMTIRDIKILMDIIRSRIKLGLQLDSSINIEFQNNLKHKNLIFSNGIDFIHEFFNFERKINNKFLSKSVQLLGKNPLMNKIFMNVADKGLVF
ncbi:FAD-dependent monooxygenase [Candidatus Pelagibacter sp.]|uniref:FAD-dependent monooxygenase n=1 Tax=Candidatus Pelagibacter sp. TaxID=2024849 RepID=UPI003F840E9C